MAVDRDEFWKKVTEIDTPEKLRALKPRQLREYQRYFVEVQYQPLAPADEKAAPNHLDRLKEEFVRRRYGWATRIGITALCAAIIGIVIGMVRCRGNSNSADSRRPTSAAISATPSVPAQQPMPTQQPTPDAAQGVNQSIPITLSVPVACNNVGEVVDLSGRLHAVIKFKRNNRYGSAYVHVNAQGSRVLAKLPVVGIKQMGRLI